MSETVLTSRRAWLRGPEGWTAGRLRLTDERLAFTGSEVAVEVRLGAIERVRLTPLPRRALLLTTADGPIRLRCFATPAIAALIVLART